MENTNLYATYDKGSNSFVSYFTSPSDITAKRSVKSMLQAMASKENLPDDETLDCLAIYKIVNLSVADLTSVLKDGPVATFNEILGKEN